MRDEYTLINVREASLVDEGDIITLSAVERSERNVSIDNIALIARELSVDPWRLLKEDYKSGFSGASHRT